MVSIVPVLHRPALRVENREPVVVIADIHLGLEAEKRRRGVRIPSQTDRLLGALRGAVEEAGARRVVMLGDVKHTVGGSSWMERREVPRFFASLRERVPVEIVPGNHDGLLRDLLGDTVAIHPMSGALIDGVGYLHGHTWPAPGLLKAPALILGHDHLVVEFRDEVGGRQREPVWIRAHLRPSRLPKRLRAVCRRRIPVYLMPAFNPLLAGVPVNRLGPRGVIGPLFKSEAIDLPRGEVYLLDGTYLGEVKDLPGEPFEGPVPRLGRH
ncbi:MAG: metallophosphoesterase [Euryarchaeota archaeon]|nr:metallophosphoesterase [Euryarchaeota archaeon]